MQAAIKKKAKQKRRSGDQGGVAADVQITSPLPPHLQTPAVAASSETEGVEECEELDRELEEMMEAQPRREKDKEEAEPADLLPIVDSVFGQVRAISTCGCVRERDP